MGKLTNDFSYSGTRLSKFNSCQWAYYLYYYYSWEGWLAGKDTDKYKIYKAKRSYPYPAWIGTLLHIWIKQYLSMYIAKNKLVDQTKFLKYVAKEFDSHWSLSEAGELTDSKDIVIFEHEKYDRATTWAIIRHNLNNAIKIIDTLKFNLDEVLTIDVDDFSQFFYIDKIKVFSIVDFAYTDSVREKINIFDWKTGKWENDGQSDQLLLYAMYYISEFSEEKLTPNNFNLTEVYTNSRNFNSTKPSEKEFLRIADKIRNDVSKLTPTLVNEDITTNIPIESKFIPTNNSNTCANCIFSQYCVFKRR